jgi:hypothetical protein
MVTKIVIGIYPIYLLNIYHIVSTYLPTITSTLSRTYLLTWLVLMPASPGGGAAPVFGAAFMK